MVLAQSGEEHGALATPAQTDWLSPKSSTSLPEASHLTKEGAQHGGGDLRRSRMDLFQARVAEAKPSPGSPSLPAPTPSWRPCTRAAANSEGRQTNCPYCPCTAFGAKQLGPLVHNCRTCHMLPTRSKRTPRKCLCVPSINIQPMRLWASRQNATPLPLAHTKASTPNCKVVANFASAVMLRTMDIGHSIKV